MDKQQIEKWACEAEIESVNAAIVRTVLPEAYSIINEMVRDAPELQKSLLIRARKLLPETYSESFAGIRARGESVKA